MRADHLGTCEVDWLCPFFLVMNVIRVEEMYLTLLSRPNLTPLGVVSGPFRPGLHTRSTRQGNYLKIRLGWYFFDPIT